MHNSLVIQFTGCQVKLGGFPIATVFSQVFFTVRCPDQDLARELAGSKFSIQLRLLQLEAQVVSDSQDCLRSSSCKRRLCQLLLLSQVQVPPIVYLVGDGSIDARAKRRLGNQTVEPRKGLLEELAGPAQFRPWVAGPRIVPKISILG